MLLLAVECSPLAIGVNGLGGGQRGKGSNNELKGFVTLQRFTSRCNPPGFNTKGMDNFTFVTLFL